MTMQTFIRGLHNPNTADSQDNSDYIFFSAFRLDIINNIIQNRLRDAQNAVKEEATLIWCLLQAIFCFQQKAQRDYLIEKLLLN